MNHRYLIEIKKLQDLFKPLGFEVAVGGGLAYDAYIGKFSRPHGDLDIDIIGKVDHKTGFTTVSKSVFKTYPNISTVKNYRLIVEDGKFVIDIEYVQIIDESKNIYQYADGCYTYPVVTYLHNRGKIGKYIFTIENPNSLFVIKLLQPILGKKSIRLKDVHDLKLIRPYLDFDQLIKSCEFELNYFKERLNKTK